MDIQPRPIAVTVSAPRPNLRLCMSPPLAGILLHGPGAGARYNSAVRRIEAVVFDIGGVVQESPLHAIARYERDHGLPPDAVQPCRRRRRRRRRVGAARARGADGRVVPGALRSGLPRPRHPRERRTPHGVHRRGEPSTAADAGGGPDDPGARTPRGRPHEQLGGRGAASDGRAPRALRRLRGVRGRGPAEARPAHLRARLPRAQGTAVARRVPRRPRHEPQAGARARDGHDQGGRPGPGAPRAFGAPRARPLATPATMRAMTKVTKSLAVGFAGVDATVSAEIKPIPFRTELSLAPLVAFWARTFGDDTSLKGTFARTIREATEAAPELLAPITDPSVIDRHRKLVDMLMAAVFPAAVLDREYGAAITPFQLRGFYATPP